MIFCGLYERGQMFNAFSMPRGHSILMYVISEDTNAPSQCNLAMVQLLFRP